ncbi:MAG: hypothetical protein IIZ93_14150 [Acidaminococcaceae bacterium]|nr:hypothetical protein [Acidaminococcaceae bacterium]
MIGKLKDLYRLQGGEWMFSLVTRDDPGKLFDDLKDVPVRIDIKKASKHRSLSANNYAWVLIDQIAAKTGYSVTEVYQTAIREIGGVSDYYGMKETAYESFCEIWTKGHLGRQVEIIPGSAKPGWINVRAWKGSSDFDSAQMARLIDSLVQEAEQQGIPTVPQTEVERMVKQWGKASCSREKDVSSAAG